MSAKCTDDQACALEIIYDELDLDRLQIQVIDAVGGYWADSINDRIADLDCEIRETIRGMRKEADGA